jgi:hypothetical protein
MHGTSWAALVLIWNSKIRVKSPSLRGAITNPSKVNLIHFSSISVQQRANNSHKSALLQSSKGLLEGNTQNGKSMTIYF